MASREAESIVRNHVLWSVGAGAFPIPGIDLVAVATIQLDMLKQLGQHYGVPYTEAQGKAWLGALSASLVARLGANAMKLIPGIGTIIGGVSMSILSGASTYALGQVALEHLGGEGGFNDLDLDDAKSRYADAYEEGKRVAKDARSEADAQNKDPVAQLERLATLHESGALSDEEFAAAKAKLLE